MEKFEIDTVIGFIQGVQEHAPGSLCPRCGRNCMEEKIVMNSLSRRLPVYVCNDCGLDEALNDVFGTDIPITQWAAFKENKEVQEA